MSILQSFIAGQEARRQADAAAEVAKVQNFMAQYGQQIFQGDQNALGQLAGMGGQGLEMAMNLRNANDQRAAAQAAQAREGVVAGRQDQEWKWRLEEHAASLDAATREAERAKIAEGLAGAAYFHARGDQQGYEKFLAENDIDPAQFPFEQFPAHAARFKEVLDVYDKFKPETPNPAALTEGAPAGTMWVDPNNRALGVKPLPGAEKPQAPYTAQGKLKADLDAGRIDQAQYEAGMAALAPKGTQLSFDPATGQMTFTQGAAVGGAPGQTVGDVYKPGTTDQAVALIDDILSNPALGRITGPIEGGGGNNIDELSAIQRAWYGEQGLDAIDKTNQLQSQAWMAARAMLKGGGQITDYESKKAEAAVARLSRAKGEAEFRSALQDLRDAITEGEAKLRAAGSGSPETPPAPADSTPSPQPAAPLPPDLQSIYDKYSTP